MAPNVFQPLKRQNILDLLRFLTILAVILAHFTDTFNRVYQIVPGNLKFNTIFRYAHITLAVLFLISGYVVTMTSLNKDLKTFFITRFSRLYPLFWISCMVAYLLPKITTMPTYLPKSNFEIFLSNLTMMPYLFRHELLNPVLWTLIIEVFFYIFIALIIIFRLWKHSLLIIGFVLIICLFTSKDGISAVIPRFTPFFMAGMLFYFVQIKFSAKWKLYSLLVLSLVCSLQGMEHLASELRPLYTEPHAYHTTVIWALVIAVFAGFLFIIERKLNLPDHPVYQTLGDISYPLYLFHIYWLGLYWYFRETVQPQLLLGTLILIMLITSWLINIYIEKPFGKLVKKILTYLLSFKENMPIKFRLEKYIIRKVFKAHYNKI